MSSRRLAWLLPLAGLLAGLALTAAAGAAEPLFAQGASTSEVRLGAALGAARGWTPAIEPPGPQFGFTGRATLGCSGLDYSGFLRSYNVDDLLHQMRNQLLGGAQAAAADYLIMLAYSNPTLASVLDTLNQNYSARFGVFQTACNAMQARQQGLEAGARRMATAQDQCYEAQVAAGASPSSAYQTCANEATLGAVTGPLPAAKSAIEFLRDHTTLQITPPVRALLALLPDTRIGTNGLEVAPPQVRLDQLNRRVESRVGLALDRIFAGESPLAMPACADDVLLADAASAADACIPAAATDVLQSGVMLSGRQLAPGARRLYRDAIAAQVAMLHIRGALLELMTQVRQLAGRTGASGRDVLDRRRELEEQIHLLTREADALQAWQQAKATTLRTQFMASEWASAVPRSSAEPDRGRAPDSALYSALRGLLAR